MNSELDIPGIENAEIFSRDKHTISRKNISRNALKVLYRLLNAGFQAYIVGGSVRDLLLNKKPKDLFGEDCSGHMADRRAVKRPKQSGVISDAFGIDVSVIEEEHF